MGIDEDFTNGQKRVSETLGIADDRMLALYKIVRHIRIDAKCPLDVMVAILKISNVPTELVYMAYIMRDVGVE